MRRNAWWIACLVSLALSGCFDDDEDQQQSPSSSLTPASGGGTSNSIPSGNRRPSISGTPRNYTVVGESYSFTPAASDGDGDRLRFTIRNLPSWATFDSGTGTVAGTPSVGDEGTYPQISISVTDGQASSTLAGFFVSVAAQVAPPAPPAPAPAPPSGNPGPGDSGSGNPGPGDSGSAPANSPPAISGAPASVAQVGEGYWFRPTASDPDGDALTFTVTNRPSWMTFNETNGAIRGTPDQGDVGRYSDIRIVASDGTASSSLRFSIEVTAEAVNRVSVTVTWDPPRENEDGTPFTDLAAYKFYYGTSSGNYSSQVRVDDPDLRSYVIEDLTPNTYFVAVSAINEAGRESQWSDEASIVIPPQ